MTPDGDGVFYVSPDKPIYCHRCSKYLNTEKSIITYGGHFYCTPCGLHEQAVNMHRRLRK